LLRLLYDAVEQVHHRGSASNSSSRIGTFFDYHMGQLIMNPNPPSIRKAINFAWATYKEHYGLFAAMILTFFASWVVLEVAVVVGQKHGLLLWTVAHLIFFLFFAGLEVGRIQVCLALLDEKQVSYSDIFRGLHLGIKFFAAQSIYLVMVLVGLVLLIIPGIYFGIRYSLFGFYFVEGNSDLKQSFQQSAVTSQGSMRFLLLFFIIIFLLNILGASLLGIGLIVTIPLSVLMTTSIYRQLSETSPIS
jgi:hypothetical protein